MRVKVNYSFTWWARRKQKQNGREMSGMRMERYGHFDRRINTHYSIIDFVQWQ